MLFIGYSSEDRYSVVEPILFHLKHFGLKVWYDFSDMFLGDNRYQTNFEQGIGTSSYIIFIISPHFFDSVCAMEELAFAKGIVENGKAVLFPIFYNYSPTELPEDLSWLRNIIYNEVQNDSGTRHVAYQIIERVIHDELLSLPYLSLDLLMQNQRFQDDYVASLLKSWAAVDARSYGVRIGILYSLYQYLPCLETKYNAAIEYVFLLLQMNETPDHLIYSIFEKSILAYCECHLMNS